MDVLGQVRQVVATRGDVRQGHPAKVSDDESFEPIQRGQLLAHRHDGTKVNAERDGWIVFPNLAARVNEEWFYLAESSDRLAR